MPTGLRNVVCDECYGGKLVFLSTGERQLQHQPGCPFKYREDTFLIDLHLAMAEKNPKAYEGTIIEYPKEAKLNPIIYDLLCDGYFTQPGNRTFGSNINHQTKAQVRAQKVNQNFQLVKEAMKQDGTWT